MAARAKLVSVRFSPPLGEADRQKTLIALAEASQFAGAADRDPWEFAVELSTLLAMGHSAGAIRFLVHEGYLAHAQDVTRSGDAVRRFRPIASLSFPPRTCFVLTNEGLRYSREVDRGAFIPRSPQTPTAYAPADALRDCVPVWSARERTLVLEDRVVLRYLYRSPNQELVLTVFQEEGWPSRIDDPLPFIAELDSKQRIRDTVRALNAKQAEQFIHFRADGSGQCVVWQLVSALRASPVLAILPRRRAA